MTKDSKTLREAKFRQLYANPQDYPSPEKILIFIESEIESAKTEAREEGVCDCIRYLLERITEDPEGNQAYSHCAYTLRSKFLKNESL